MTLVGVAHAVTITINPNVPGTNAANAGPAGIVSNFYQFAVMIGGILALGAIVWGGVRYTMAAGNPSGQGEGKKWIMAAIYGLLLLLGAYLLLNTINPDIVSLKLPGFNGQ